MLNAQEAMTLVQKAAEIGILQSHVEARDFAVWLSQHDISDVIELGTCSGGMLRLMDLVCRKGLRISMDMPWNERDPDCSGWEMRCKSAMPHMLEVLGQIHDQAQKNKLTDLLAGRKVDLLFIDADHSAFGVAKHIEMYSEFVRLGGFIGFHDLSNGWDCGPWVKETLFPHYKHWLFEEPANLFGIGVIQV
jgi:hypothetical protein